MSSTTVPDRLVPIYINSFLRNLTSSCAWYRDFTTETEQGDDIAGDLHAENDGPKPVSVLRYRFEEAGHDPEVGCVHADVRRVPPRRSGYEVATFFCVDCGAYPAQMGDAP